MNSHSRIRSHILNGISAELSDTPSYADFEVTSTLQTGPYWVVNVKVPEKAKIGLDESLEGARAWWAGPPVGAADVLSVIADRLQINLRYATQPPPPPGGSIRIYPPQFLEALHKIWEDRECAEQSLAWLDAVENANDHDSGQVPTSDAFPWLRDAQADAFQLPGWHAGFLWGPPGTGKTTTLGAMLASYLLQYPERRVMLLSTTNTAADIALVAVDKALENLPKKLGGNKLRHHCKRVGNHFVGRHYEGREHLIPAGDEALVQQLIRLEGQRPDPEQVEAYGEWKRAVEKLREQMRVQAVAVIANSRLAAMTCTLAAFLFKDISNVVDADLIVFDEASQVGRAYALALAPLARHAVFAGDPKQLAPIVKSEHEDAVGWLGTSMFEYMDGSEATCFLDEQSRMSEDICEIVSHVFYNGRLRVAADALQKPAWRRERQLAYVAPTAGVEIGERSFCVIPVTEEGKWSHQYRGPIRHCSASLILDLVQRLAQQVNEEDILVLTPFRAQRVITKNMLKRQGFGRVDVSTVHRAQGSERHTVLFDPVAGDNPFLKTPDARRLMNVALSRAQARLLVLLSPGDRGNTLLDSIASINTGVTAAAKPIGDFIGAPDFPRCTLGKVVSIGPRIVGEVVCLLENDTKFQVRDCRSGELRTIVTDFVRNKYRGQNG